MIAVVMKPAPNGFYESVTKPGLAWLDRNGIALDVRASKGTEFKDYWTICIDDVHQAYDGVCCYLATSIERATGEVTIDHYKSKISAPRLAYEWSNYRLASSRANCLKKDYDDVLDPFEVQNDWFWLELVSGRIFPNPSLEVSHPETFARVFATISRLKLDNDHCRKMRSGHFELYKGGNISVQHLQKTNPFVYKEALRQGLL